MSKFPTRFFACALLVLPGTLASPHYALADDIASLVTKTSVVSVTPGNDSTDVELDVVVQIHFSTGLTLRTINAETVRLVDAVGSAVPMRLGFDLEGTWLTSDLRDSCGKKPSTPSRSATS
jgi:hypothetical protein